MKKAYRERKIERLKEKDGLRQKEGIKEMQWEAVDGENKKKSRNAGSQGKNKPTDRMTGRPNETPNDMWLWWCYIVCKEWNRVY